MAVDQATHLHDRAGTIGPGMLYPGGEQTRKHLQQEALAFAICFLCNKPQCKMNKAV
jgi:hypothetical protein